MTVVTSSNLDTGIAIVGFIATIASLVLAIGAIWLSFVFYRMSNEASKETTKASKDIQSSVERLEKIFDKLYSDTFAMMKDTVTDMREHIWKKPPPNNTSDIISNEEIIKTMRNDITNDIIKLVDDKFQNNKNSEKIKELELKIKESLDTALLKTMQLQHNPYELTRKRVLDSIKQKNKVSLDKLITTMNVKYPEEYSMDAPDFINALFDLREKGLITWDGPKSTIATRSILEYVDNNKKIQ